MSSWEKLTKAASKAGWSIPADPVKEAYSVLKLNGLTLDLTKGVNKARETLLDYENRNCHDENEAYCFHVFLALLTAKELQAKSLDSKMFFVESQRMVELISSTEVDVGSNEFYIPDCLYFCPPKGVMIDGFELPPFYVRGISNIVGSDGNEIYPDLNIYFFKFPALSWILFQEDVSNILNGQGFHRQLSDDGSPSMPIEKIIRILFQTLAWMNERPEIVKDGVPDAIRKATAKYSSLPPMALVSEPPECGSNPAMWKSHASPCFHIREGHWCRYPINKNGGRREGVFWKLGYLLDGSTP